MIKAVIFDVDDTLYDFKTAEALGRTTIREYAARECGVDGELFLNTFVDVLHEQMRLHGRSAGCHSRAIRAQITCERLGIPIHHAPAINDLFWNTFIESIRPFDGIPELFREIKARGLKIGICTNMTADWQIKKLIKLGICDYCDFVASSEEADSEKPDKGIFLLCAEKAKCAIDECLLIGDNPVFDAQGALDAGMQARWFAPDPAKRAEHPELQYITSPREVLDCLND